MNKSIQAQLVITSTYAGMTKGVTIYYDPMADQESGDNVKVVSGMTPGIRRISFTEFKKIAKSSFPGILDEVTKKMRSAKRFPVRRPGDKATKADLQKIANLLGMGT